MSTAAVHPGQRTNAQQLINQSASVVDKMKSDPHLVDLIRQAKAYSSSPASGAAP
jgi:hypothetical protein